MSSAADTNLNILVTGPWASVEYGVCHNHAQPAKEFLKALDKKTYTQVMALFHRSTQGLISNEQQFKHEHGKIFCYKRRQIRISCFKIGRRWILLHGFYKKSPKWGRELKTAERLMHEHLEMENAANARENKQT